MTPLQWVFLGVAGWIVLAAVVGLLWALAGCNLNKETP